MPTEVIATSLINRFSALTTPAEKPLAYYRSKLYTANATQNPLVAAANPLFSFLERVSVSQSLPQIQSIRDNIEHELRAFRSRLYTLHYAETLISLAEYLLTGTIDELLGKNYLRLYGNAPNFAAFTPSSEDNKGPDERFFDIVQYLKEYPHQYLDLIELAYYCLISGFEGKYFGKPDGRRELDSLIETLFQLIERHRVNKPHVLFREKILKLPEKVNPLPLLVAILISITLTLLTYGLSRFLVESKANKVLHQHQITKTLEHYG